MVPEATGVARARKQLVMLGGGPHIGIAADCGKSGPPVFHDPRAAAGFWSALQRLTADLPGATFVDLDRISTTNPFLQAAARENVTVHRWPGPSDCGDVDELASRIAAVDVVLSTGGISAHLAGGLGRPGWLLPVRSASCHAMCLGERSAWHPTLRMIQSATGREADTSNPFLRLHAELLNLLASPADLNRMRSISGPHWNSRTQVVR